MNNEATRLSEHDRRLDEIVTAYLKAVEAGDNPEPNDWLQRYPDLAAELSAFFAGQAQVAALAGRETIGRRRRVLGPSGPAGADADISAPAADAFQQTPETPIRLRALSGSAIPRSLTHFG
jgi:hypothetical protein